MSLNRVNRRPQRVPCDSSEIGTQVRELTAHRLLPFAELLAQRGLTSPLVAGVARDLIAGRPVVTLEQLVEERRVANAMSTDPVNALIMKGAALAATVYDDPQTRARSDLDLMVARERLAPARDCLVELGYQSGWSVQSSVPLRQEQWCRRAGDKVFTVDLHWELRNHPVLVGLIDWEELEAAAVTVEKLGSDVRALGLVHALLLSAAHWFVNAPSERANVWLLDSELLWQHMTARQRTEVVELAIERQLAGLLGAHLALCREKLGSPVPENIVNHLICTGNNMRPTGLIEASSSLRASLFFEFRCEPGWWARLTRLRFLMFPPAAYVRQCFPKGSRLGLVGLYLRRLMGIVRQTWSERADKP